jgi:hypothetical protein
VHEENVWVREAANAYAKKNAKKSETLVA